MLSVSMNKICGRWKIINAADYSMPQRRRRVYIVGYHKSSDLYKKMKSLSKDLITKHGIISGAFNVNYDANHKIFENISKTNEVSKEFNAGGKLSPFKNSGVMFDGKFFSVKTISVKTEKFPLGKILQKSNEIDTSFYIKKIKG